MYKEKTEGEGLVCLTMPMCDKTVTHETSGDFIIPDYQPELRRLLGVSERVLPPARYVSGKGVECNGTVDYTVLYMGADGGVYSLSVSSEYELCVPIDNVDCFELSEGSSVAIHTRCDGTTARVTSPRKISIRSKLASHVRAYGNVKLEDGCAESAGIQRLWREVENSRIFTTGSDVIGVETEIGGMGEDARVVSADANVFVKNARMTDGGIIAEGDVNLSMLICREDGELRSIQRKLGFEGEIDTCDGAEKGKYRICGSVTDITVNVEDGNIKADISLVLDAMTVCGVNIKYTADAYSTDRECACERETLAISANIACVNGNFSQNERLPLSETNIPAGASIIDTKGAVTFKDCSSADGKYSFFGTAKYKILYEKDGEYGMAELELPVKYSVEGAESDGYTFDATGEIISCRIRTEGELLAIDSEIAICADIFGETSVNAVRKISLGETVEARKGRMVVYFPAEDEDAWEVAKKYRVPIENLTAEKNYYIL